jgi:hypothetical protein
MKWKNCKPVIAAALTDRQHAVLTGLRIKEKSLIKAILERLKKETLKGDGKFYFSFMARITAAFPMYNEYGIYFPKLCGSGYFFHLHLHLQVHITAF